MRILLARGFRKTYSETAMSWSETFRTYIDQRFGAAAQQRTAEAFNVSPSTVSYWCRGSKPRRKRREEIAEWSSGAVPIEPAEASSPDLDEPVTS